MRVIALSLFITCTLGVAHSRAKLPDAITFHDEVYDEMKEDCEKLTYCTTKPKDYPQEKFNEIFKSHTVLHRPAPLMEFPNRVSEELNDDQCKSKIVNKKLYQVRSKPEDKWKIVVQVPKIKFSQKVRMEICESTGSECFTVFPGRGMYKVGCLQKHMTWKVLVYNAEKNNTETINATVPSCCSCHYSDNV